ncbi:hypothetical protein H4Q26_013274 [Puccinia striiformis f. sp. tritici PST-130]|nr:hypothetical protein H4Q26_013274 [Puccinia striiformis f. sp. tritici PST-130]
MTSISNTQIKLSDPVARKIARSFQFTAKDWMLIDELNWELKPFNCLTKIMEGDGPTGAFVLPNYYQTISNLKTKEAACDWGHALHPMFVKMIDKLSIPSRGT